MNQKRNRYIDPETKLLDPRCRDIEPARGDLGYTQCLTKSVNTATRQVTALVSTPNPDRYEEIVLPEAFAKWLSVFESNPVLVASHNSGGGVSGEPTVIGSWSDIRISDEGMHATATFAQTPLAAEYFQLYADNHMRAFSVGWITHEWQMREFEVAKGVTKKIRVFTEVELIEISAVAIPANREALVRAASALVQGGASDRSVGSDMAESLLDRLREGIDEQVQQAIKKCLNAEPGGQLCTLFQDVVEGVQGRGAEGNDDDDRQDAAAQSMQEQLREFTKRLNRVLSKR